jgi:uncharacterized linocin/CFP29 family protein
MIAGRMQPPLAISRRMINICQNKFIERKSELAPIPVGAWAEIDAQATRSLKAMLSGRKALDVTGPMGTEFPGVPEGRLTYPAKQPKGGLT